MIKHIVIVGDIHAKHLNQVLRDVLRPGTTLNLLMIPATNLPTHTQIATEAAHGTAAIEPLPANPGEVYADRIAQRERELVKQVLGDITLDDVVTSVWESAQVNLELGWLVNALPQSHDEYVIDSEDKLVLYPGLVTA